MFEYLTTNDGINRLDGPVRRSRPDARRAFAVDIAGHPVRGKYLHVEPPSRVVISWGFAGSEELPAGASTVEFRLTPIGGGTRVDLRHGDLPSTEVRGHADGWANFLPRLAIVGAGGEAGQDDWQPPPTVEDAKITESVLIFDRLSYGPPEQA